MALKIRPEELRSQLSSAQRVGVLDVRSAGEFATGHIPGAVNIPMGQVEARMPDLPAAPLVIVCEAGKRAESILTTLA